MWDNKEFDRGGGLHSNIVLGPARSCHKVKMAMRTVEAGTKFQKRETYAPIRGLHGPFHNIDFSTIRPKYEDYLYHLRRTGYTAYNPGFTQRSLPRSSFSYHRNRVTQLPVPSSSDASQLFFGTFGSPLYDEHRLMMLAPRNVVSPSTGQFERQEILLR